MTNTTDLPPLPEPYLSAFACRSLLGPNVDEPLFTSDQMRAYATAAVLAERAKAEAMRAALAELVACDDLRIRAGKISPVEPGYEKEVLMDEWRRRDRVAWAAARAAIHAEPKEQQP